MALPRLDRRYALALAATATAYAATATLGLNWSAFPGAGTAIWPAAGVAFAALMIGGIRLWPAIVVGRLATAIIVASPVAFWIDLLVALASAAGAVVPVHLIERGGGLDRNLASMRDISWLALGGAIGGGAVSASLGVAALLLGGAVRLDAAAALWAGWSTGFAVGTLVIAPLILAWWRRTAWRMPTEAWVHYGACMATVTLVSYVTFYSQRLFPAWYIYPALVWAALAFQVRGAAVALLIASLFAIISAAQGTGMLTAFADDVTGRVLFAQQFVAVSALTILFLAAIADERRATARLRESERRFRLMADSSPALIWVTDQSGALTFVNRRYQEVFGQPPEAMLTGGWQQVVHPGDVDEFVAAFREAFTARSRFERDVRVVDRDGQPRWYHCEGIPRFARGRFAGYTGVNVDITAAKRGEEHRKLLINELNHRVKNTLAIVQSIAQQSFRDERVPGELLTAFEGRLATLAAAHNVLTRENWEAAPLRRIVEDSVGPFGAARFMLDGPDLRIAPRSTVTVALALHELATNAAKYGALSVEGGHVEIGWRIGAAPLDFELHWRERGGPPVAPPAHRGFGSRLIERSLAAKLGGEAHIDYAPDGVRCDIRAPLARLTG